MRIVLIAAAVALAACSKPQPAAPPAIAGTYAGVGRDALCFATAGGATRAGFIIYGPDRANCSVSGRLDKAGAGWTLRPTGDGECRIAVRFTNGKVTLGPQSAACAYYCGPGATFDGKSFTLSPSAPAASDVAGDALC
jgi:hypothetical protein